MSKALEVRGAKRPKVGGRALPDRAPCKALAAQGAKRPKPGGRASPDRAPCKALAAQGAKRPKPGGRASPDRAPCKALAAQGAKRPKPGGRASPDRAPCKALAAQGAKRPKPGGRALSFARGCAVFVFVCMVSDAPPVVAQVGTGTVSATSSTAKPPPPPPPRTRRRPRRTARRRRARRLVIAKPTAADRYLELRPEPIYVGTLRRIPESQAGGQAPKSAEQQWSEALWGVWYVLALGLVGLRIVAWLIRQLAQRQVYLARSVERSWPLLEGLAWIGVGIWVLDRLSSRPGIGAAAAATGGLILVVTLSFNAIRDVVAGLLLNLERPFELGDFVRVADAEGQVHAFRTRVVELVAPDGHRLFVPYRTLAGITDVRPGGYKKAHSVSVTLPVPDGVEASEALAVAEEVARASPWSTLAADPRITLVEHPTISVQVETFAFDREAQSLLHAELMQSWTNACRRLS